MNHLQLQPLSDAELRSVEGGSIFGDIADAVAKVISILRCTGRACT